MKRRQFVQAAIGAAAVAQVATGEEQAPAEECDVFVYGSTPGGLAAAIEAARRGCKVILACPKRHPGGMTASGLCTTDAVRQHLFGGLVIEFISGVRKDYLREMGENSPDWPLIREGWFYEPSVAERVFERMLEAEAEQLTFLRGYHLVSAELAGDKVTSVKLDSPEGGKRVFRASTFIDGTYEGDLAAAAGVDYRVGREGRDEFSESLAGIHYMDWKKGVQIMTPDTGEPSPADPGVLRSFDLYGRSGQDDSAEEAGQLRAASSRSSPSPR